MFLHLVYPVVPAMRDRLSTEITIDQTQVAWSAQRLLRSEHALISHEDLPYLIRRTEFRYLFVPVHD
jgi:hypothetical protein